MNDPLARSSIFAHSRIDITLVRAGAAQLDVPFHYFSNCLSSLTGYFEPLNGKPNVPIAWGASRYNKFYNWRSSGNSCYAENHYRPRLRWTKYRRFHEQIKSQQKAAQVYTIGTWYALGFVAKKNRRMLAA